MLRKGRVYRKFKMSMLKSMVAVAFCAMLIYPLTAPAAKGNLHDDEPVNAGSFMGSLLKKGDKEQKQIYEVLINDEVVGYVEDASVVENIYLNTRMQINSSSPSVVYIDTDIRCAPSDKNVKELTDSEELKTAIYNGLMNGIVTPKESAYTLKVGDVTVYLADSAQVMELFQRIKDKYDPDGIFEVVLSEKEGNMFTTFTASIVLPETKENNVVTVYAANGSAGSDDAEEDKEVIEDGLKSITFEEDIEIVESYVAENQIMTVDEAFEFLTKENEENKVYIVVKGDSMWKIAKEHGMSTSQLFALNTNITEKSIIHIGQEVIITVPEPELSVLTEEVITYEEAYNAPVQYIYNKDWYTTKSVVQQAGSEGYHVVTADVTYRNGRECSRDILDEEIIEASVPKIIEVGTKEPPTYIKPIVGGRVTSNFGQRWGTLHKGVDWGIATGTTVMASCSGKVIQAGWNGSYGYSILLEHSDGSRTRYAHLSKVLVKVGQQVKQGEKIALSGNTGNSTGPHLHFELIINGKLVNPLNYVK